MRSFVFCLFCASALFAQTPPPPIAPGTPGPPPVGQAAPLAAPPAPIAPDAVVIEVSGKKYSKAEVDALIQGLPPQIQPQVRMQPVMLSQFFMIKRLADDAVKAGLDRQSPYKEAIEFNRMTILQQAQTTTYLNTIQVTPEELQAYYKENPDKFREAKVRVIYISFTSSNAATGTNGKKLLSETDAKAKIDDLRKQILAGGDFVKLARENSDDDTSAAKGGDYGLIKHNSPYPEPIKNAVFALKGGEVSEPVRQPNGFYLIRADEVSSQPFDEVSTEILKEIRQKRFNDYMKGLQDEYKVKVENPAYFTPQPGPPQLKNVPH